MPHYDYVCTACGHEFEVFQSMTEATKRKCPECGRLKLQRKIGTGAGVLFKGSGFYETDYRSESYKRGAKESTEPKPSEPAKSAEKPAKKGDSKKKSD